MINNKTEINQKNKDGYTPLMIALKNKQNENIIKLLINNKTDINQKVKDRNILFNKNTPLKILLQNYSKKSLSSILSFFYFVNKKVIKMIFPIIDDSNSKYFLDIPVFKEKDIFNWNLSNYLYWKQRNRNINYFLIFSY